MNITSCSAVTPKHWIGNLSLCSFATLGRREYLIEAFTTRTYCLYFEVLIPRKMSATSWIAQCPLSFVLGLTRNTRRQTYENCSSTLLSIVQWKYGRGESARRTVTTSICFMTSHEANSLFYRRITIFTRIGYLIQPWSDSAISCETQERRRHFSIRTRTEPVPQSCEETKVAQLAPMAWVSWIPVKGQRHWHHPLDIAVATRTEAVVKPVSILLPDVSQWMLRIDKLANEGKDFLHCVCVARNGPDCHKIAFFIGRNKSIHCRRLHHCTASTSDAGRALGGPMGLTVLARCLLVPYGVLSRHQRTQCGSRTFQTPTRAWIRN